MKIFAILLIGLSTIAQNPISIRLIDLKTGKSDPKQRIFNISYSIANETDKPIAFFLTTTEGFIPQISSSSLDYVHYRLFQNDKPVDAPATFTFGVATRLSQPEMDLKMDSIRTKLMNIGLALKQRREHIQNSLMRLGPKETKTFSVIMAWDHERYQRYDEIEYYLEPSDQYAIELSAHLMKEELYGEFKAVGMEKLLDEPNLVTGWFTSNRLPIDLSE